MGLKVKALRLPVQLENTKKYQSTILVFSYKIGAKIKS